MADAERATERTPLVGNRAAAEQEAAEANSSAFFSGVGELIHSYITTVHDKIRNTSLMHFLLQHSTRMLVASRRSQVFMELFQRRTKKLLTPASSKLRKEPLEQISVCCPVSFCLSAVTYAYHH